jgi:DNA-binding protein
MPKDNYYLLSSQNEQKQDLNEVRISMKKQLGNYLLMIGDKLINQKVKQVVLVGTGIAIS